MKAELEKLCTDYIANRDTVRKAFRWDSKDFYPVCANVLCAYGLSADTDRLKACRKLIGKYTRPFSRFRGMVRPVLSCMLSAGEDPDGRMALADQYYRLLKRKFRGTEYLVLAAFLLTDLADRELSADTVARGKEIFRLMNRKHRLLTNRTDCVFAVLLACSGKSDDELSADLEACYQTLKSGFSSSSDVQTASQVLSMIPGSPEDKAQRVIRLYDELESAGVRYSRSSGLAPLAALSLADTPVSVLAEEIAAVDAFLKDNEDCGTKEKELEERALHAVMIVSDQYAGTKHVNSTVMTNTLDMLISQKRASLVSFLFQVLQGLASYAFKSKEDQPESDESSAEDMPESEKQPEK